MLFFSLDLWTSTGFRSLCHLGHLRSHHQEALFTWARSRREENPEAWCALHILHPIFAYHHSEWYNFKVEPKKITVFLKKTGWNGHPRFLKNEMWDSVYFIRKQQGVEDDHATQMCARCFFLCFWGCLGSKRFICQQDSHCYWKAYMLKHIAFTAGGVVRQNSCHLHPIPSSHWWKSIHISCCLTKIYQTVIWLEIPLHPPLSIHLFQLPSLKLTVRTWK